MGRLILLVAIAIAVVWLLRRAMSGPPSGGGGPRAAEPPQGDLVRCAHCGVNLPATEARSAGGRHYCSEEHWRAGPRDG
jgi:uncharacterized protein